MYLELRTALATCAVAAGLVLIQPAPNSGAAAACFGLRPTVPGYSGDDVLVGTEGNDVIVGRGGDDTIDGRGGDDRICGGDGTDVILGGAGNDMVLGGAGGDVIDAGDGDDYVDAAGGPDLIDGGMGDDDVHGGSEDDVFLEGAVPNGADIITGDAHVDVLKYDGRTNGVTVDPNGLADDGEAGERDNVIADFEEVHGTAAADHLVGLGLPNVFYGGAGDDMIEGGLGQDQLYGGVGDDHLYGQENFDTLDGGGDIDVCRVYPQGGTVDRCEVTVT